MLFYWLLFFFLAVGAKVLLALVMIYFLLSGDRLCSHCDEETLLLQTGRMGKIGRRITFGRVEWRWCPRCGWEGLARTPRSRRRTGWSVSRPVRKDVTIFPDR